RVGDRVVSLSDLGGREREPVDTPIAGSGLPAALALRGALAPGAVAETVDEAGTPTLSVARPARGTDWWLGAEVARDEVEAPAPARAVDTTALAVLVLLGLGLGGRLIAQRRALQIGQRERRQQRERLRSLAILEAIARSANEAIYAKDLDGRYVFC